MDFGDGVAAYSIKMSHAIGDGTTYFQLVSQISSYMNGRTPAKIDWDNPLKATHEIYPETFSERDYERSYGLPFGWGLLKVSFNSCLFDLYFIWAFDIHVRSILSKESTHTWQAEMHVLVAQ
jgi:hypothetical protein